MLRYPKNLKGLCVFLLFITTLLAGCVFKSDEEYFNDLEIPDPANVGVSINTIDLAEYNPGDTIDLYGSTVFNFALSGTHGDIESAYVYLTDERGAWRTVSSGSASSFSIGLYDLRSGTFGLKFDLTIRSGSGSLADKIKIEKMKVSRQWVVRVDVSLPPKPVPTVNVQEGFLTIQWSAYTKPNFKSYLIRRTSPSGASKTFEIKDKTITRWKDENYVGGYKSPTEYSVSIVSEVGTSTSVPIPRTDPMVVDFSFNPQDSVITLKWRRTKFYGTFKDYQFSATGVSVSNAPILTNINDTTLTYKYSAIRFGSEYNALLTVRSKMEGIPNYATLGGVCKLGTPLPFTPVGEIRFNSFLNAYVAVDKDKKLLELNQQLEPVRTIATLKGNDWRMPYPGNYIFTIASNDDDKIYRLKLQDNTEVSYESVYLSYNKSNTVASNGLICMDYNRPPVANLKALFVISAFDLAGGGSGSVFNENSNTVNLSAVISEDGKYIWANNNRVFKITGNSSQLIGSFTGTGSFVGFRQDNSEEMMFRDEDKINFYNTNTFALIRSINPPANNMYWSGHYDIQDKEMLWASNSSASRIYTVNLQTGVVRRIEVSTSGASSFYKLNKLLVGNGNYIEIK